MLLTILYSGSIIGTVSLLLFLGRSVRWEGTGLYLFLIPFLADFVLHVVVASKHGRFSPSFFSWSVALVSVVTGLLALIVTLVFAGYYRDLLQTSVPLFVGIALGYAMLATVSSFVPNKKARGLPSSENMVRIMFIGAMVLALVIFVVMYFSWSEFQAGLESGTRDYKENVFITLGGLMGLGTSTGVIFASATHYGARARAIAKNWTPVEGAHPVTRVLGTHGIGVIGPAMVLAMVFFAGFE